MYWTSIIYLVVRALTVISREVHISFFSRLSVLYILYIFPLRQSYIAAYMKWENCVLLSRVNCILWNKITVYHSLKTEVFQGKFHNAFCSWRDLLKLCLRNRLGVCFLLNHGLVLANLTMINSMILRGLMQWHFWETVALIFSYILFPYSFT